MRTPMHRPSLLLFGLLTTLSSPNALPAQDFIPYIGGGLRLGYAFGEGPSFGAEVTLGVLQDIGRTAGLTSIALGIQNNPIAPGPLTYVSWAAATLIPPMDLVGIAVGRTYYSLDGKNYWGTRSILWGGPLFILVSLESYRFPNLDTRKWSIGLWGRLAWPLVDFHYT